MQLHKKIAKINGAAASNIMTVDLVTGIKEVMGVGLTHGGTAPDKADYSNWQVLINSNPIQQFLTTAHLEKISAYKGLNVVSDEVFFPFFKEELKDASMAGGFNIGLADVDTMQITCDVGSGAPGDLTMAGVVKETVRTVKGATQEQLRALNGLGMFTRIVPASYSLVGATTTEIDNLPKQGLLQYLHLFPVSNVITRVELWLGDLLVWNLSKAQMEAMVERAGRTVATNDYHLDFMLANELGDEVPLEGVSDYRLKITHSGSSNLTIYQETTDVWRSGN